MWTSGFFDSINGDRTYNAAQLSGIFEGLITDGVYQSVGKQLVVEPNSGLTIQINTGLGWFGGRWVRNTTEHLLTLESADVTLNRYAAICVRTDSTVAARTADAYVKYSAFATTPVKPTMERTDEVKEYCLAYVYIPAGATEIKGSNIEDTRSDASLCGWVTGLIEQIDATTLFRQFDAAFNEWFSGIRSYLDEDMETKLAADMLQVKNNSPHKAIGTFDGLAWNSQDSGAYYTQRVYVEGVQLTSELLVTPTEEFKDVYERSCCEAIAQEPNYITFRCLNPEDVSMKVKVVIINDAI
jgi:hypothetical protein